MLMFNKNNLIANSGLIIVVSIVILGLCGLSTAFASGNPNLLYRQVDVAATAKAIQFENNKTRLEEAAEKRRETLSKQVSQTEKSLEALLKTIREQTDRQQQQLQQLQQLLDEERATIRDSETEIIRLKQDIQSTESNTAAALATAQADATRTTAQLLQQIEAVSAQIDQARAELAARATPTFAPPALFNASDDGGDSGSSHDSGGGSSSDDDHDSSDDDHDSSDDDHDSSDDSDDSDDDD